MRLAEAAVARGAGNTDAAFDAYREAIGLLESLALSLDAAEARMTYADALRDGGDMTLAASEYAAARDAFAEMGADAMVHDIDGRLTGLP